VPGSNFFSASTNISTLTHFIQPSKEIFFALMTDGQHGHGLAILDFKQRNITVCTKADDQLAQQRVFRRCLATTEWKSAQKFDALGNDGAGVFGSFRIPFTRKSNKRYKSLAAAGVKRTV
jgi:hypothetical protein